jgi:hypothetical protein
MPETVAHDYDEDIHDRKECRVLGEKVAGKGLFGVVSSDHRLILAHQKSSTISALLGFPRTTTVGDRASLWDRPVGESETTPSYGQVVPVGPGPTSPWTLSLNVLLVFVTMAVDSQAMLRP